MFKFAFRGVQILQITSWCAVNLFSGQIAQPTTLGFTVLGAGLCWAALKNLPSVEPAIEPKVDRVPIRRI